MSGIISYGAYVPLWRLSRDAIGAAWGRASLGGERSVANNDEDTVTMAVEAVLDCLAGTDRDSIDGLYFASTTAPFREKQCATLVAAAADLKPDIITADFGNSLRAGTAAFRAALDAVNSGSAQNVIVVAADCRLGYPRSDYEQNFGDAAVALLVSKSGKPIANVKANYTISNDMYDVWRLDKDTFVQSWEERFVIEHGYTENMSKAITGLMKKQNLSAGDITKAVLYAPTARSQQQLARQLGFDPKTQLQDLLNSNLGVCGCAHALLLLAAALETAREGDKFTTKELWSNPEIGAKWNTPILKDGFLYGFTDQRRIYCIDASTGKTAWYDSTVNSDFATIVDCGTVIMGFPSTGNLIVFKADPKAYSEIAKYKVAETAVYAFPVIAGNVVYVKDAENLMMYRVE